MNRFALGLISLLVCWSQAARLRCADEKPAPPRVAKNAKAVLDAVGPKSAPRVDLFKKASEYLLDLQQKTRALETQTLERRRGLETRLAEIARDRQIIERSSSSLTRRVAELEKENEPKRVKLGKDGSDSSRFGEESARVLEEVKKYFVWLDKHVQEGIPWMQEQRKSAIAKARAALAEPDASPLVALELANRLQEEEESLGRTIEAGRVRIEVGGEHRSIPAVRLGLLSIAYASEDGTIIGYAHAGQTAEQGKIEMGASASGETADKALQKVAAGYSTALAVLERKLTPRIVDFFIPGISVSNEERR